MSQKITSKNLSYDNSLPPFLAALRAQTAGSDEHQRPSIGNRQLGKKRSASEEAEDGPVVVDEDGNVMSVEVAQDGTVKETEGKEGGDDDVKAEAGAKKEGEATKTSTIGGRKRKVGKVIGEAAAQADEAQAQDKKDGKKSNEEQDERPKEKKPKKKVKKIKLSFDEEEDG